MSNFHIAQRNKQLPEHIRETPPLYNIFMAKLILAKINWEGNLTENIVKTELLLCNFLNYLQGFKM